MQLQIIGYFLLPVLISLVRVVFNLRNNPAGNACILLLRAIISVESSSNCDISDNGVTADCSSRTNRIPEDLSSLLSNLDLSSNVFEELREKSFKKYPNLTTLILTNVTVILPRTDLYLFRPLKNLKVLNFSQSYFKSNIFTTTPKAYFYWPENLRILNLSGLHLRDIDISHLKHLEELHVKQNHLYELPKINENAPLSLIDLQSNPLDNLTPEILAPFCKLQFLNVGRLDPDFAWLISSNIRYCLCERVNLWIQSFNIKGEPLGCLKPTYNITCDETFSEETLSTYHACLERYKKKKSIIMYILIPVILILLIGASVAAYYFYTTKFKSSSDQSESTNDSPNINRGSSKTEASESET